MLYKSIGFSVIIACLQLAQAQVVPMVGGGEGSTLNQMAFEQGRAQAALSKDPSRSVYVFTGDRIIPQLVDGAGWQTQMTFVNLENHPVRFNVYFFADNGTDLYIPIVGAGVVRGVAVALSSAESTTIDTAGSGSALSQGWASFQTEDLNDSVGGITVFKQSVAGRPDSEAVVPVVNKFDAHFVLLFDNTNWVTAIAIANPSSETVVIPFNIRDEAGNIAEAQTMTLAPYEHKAFVIPDVYPITRGRRGKMEFVTPGFGIAALGLRFTGSGAFTSFHVLSNFAWK